MDDGRNKGREITEQELPLETINRKARREHEKRERNLQKLQAARQKRHDKKMAENIGI